MYAAGMSTSLPPVHPGHGRLLVALTMLTAACLGAACRNASKPPAPAVSADAWAVVDGHEITRADVEKAYRRTRDAAAPASEEEATVAKLSLLDDLIAQQILITKAAALKIDVPQSELDTAEANAKKNIPDEAFQRELAQRGLTAADMRDGLRRELVAQKVLAQEVTAKVTVTDQDITEFFNANRAQFNVPEEAYHLAQIVVTPTREAQVANSTGDDATSPQAATAKVQMLMERLKAGASFRDLAIGFSEDPDTAPRGGDLGLVTISRLRQAPPQLRDAVLNKSPGTVNVAAAAGAYTLVLVVAHEQAGQRDLSTPGMKDNLKESLRARREQVLRAAYLTAVRNDATVVNYLARRLVDAKGTPPATQASAPAPPAR
jgi:peptidyl-prolyl cis-trans isomerase SurA